MVIDITTNDLSTNDLTVHSSSVFKDDVIVDASLIVVDGSFNMTIHGTHTIIIL